MLLSMGPCPWCLGGNNTPCFATYSDGYKCFTCGKSKKSGGLSMAYRPSLITSDNNIRLPEHTQNICEFSPSVLKWLYSFYVYNDLIKKHGIAYTKYTEFTTERGVKYSGDGLILPVFKDGTLVFCQQRFFPDKKFITKGDKTSPFVIKCEGSVCLYIVEDYISAIRLGEFVNVLCLFGTSLHYQGVEFIRESGYDVVVWLDNDEAGEKGAAMLIDKLTKALTYNAKYRAFAIREQINISNLRTEFQPKEYSNQQLKTIIRGNHAVI
jgi:Toprim domain-containing protein